MDYREYKRELLNAIENRAKCGAVYVQTQPVRIVEDGVVRWKGKVEVYQLKEHPQAKLAFGWGYQNAQKKVEYVTVMGIPPLDTPVGAVKGFLASRR
jgi:hypothetical protein